MNQPIFFAKLRPLVHVLRSDAFMEMVFLDYEDSHDLAEQQFHFMKLFKDRGDEWIKFKKETNGYIYVDDEDAIIIVHRHWIKNKIPVKND